MNTVAIIQARMTSSRLLGKVLADIDGKPMLTHVVERVKRAKNIDEIVVATTKNPIDYDIVKLCRQNQWLCFKGSEDDVLDRYYRAALTFKASVIVRITSDCPLIEPDVVDRVIGKFIELYPDIDYASNVNPPTFPDGLDTEVMNFKTLLRLWRGCQDPEEREHVTLYIRHNPHLFKTANVSNDTDQSHIKWSVDTIDDLDRVRTIIKERRLQSQPSYYTSTHQCGLL